MRVLRQKQRHHQRNIDIHLLRFFLSHFSFLLFFSLLLLNGHTHLSSFLYLFFVGAHRQSKPHILHLLNPNQSQNPQSIFDIDCLFSLIVLLCSSQPLHYCFDCVAPFIAHKSRRTRSLFSSSVKHTHTHTHITLPSQPVAHSYLSSPLLQ